MAHGVRKPHRGDTLNPILDAPDRAALLDWLRRQRMACFEQGWLMVHAGVVPQWDRVQTLALAAEVEAVLRGPALPEFLQQMYGNEPDQWDASLSGTARLRFVVNVLTRLRFCDAQGRLDFKTKDGAGSAPEGFHPWFEVPGRRSAGTPIAFGHWSTLGLINRPDLLALDTGCVWGGQLTAMRVDGGRREAIQVPCEQAQTPGE
jgi:bis(5'-nucleosyl)-tetraphosphatase (symmetrical)